MSIRFPPINDKLFRPLTWEECVKEASIYDQTARRMFPGLPLRTLEILSKWAFDEAHEMYLAERELLKDRQSIKHSAEFLKEWSDVLYLCASVSALVDSHEGVQLCSQLLNLPTFRSGGTTGVILSGVSGHYAAAFRIVCLDNLFRLDTATFRESDGKIIKSPEYPKHQVIERIVDVFCFRRP